MIISGYGDFFIKPEFVKEYEIIDFHTHTFSSISGTFPKLFRKKISRLQKRSIFDLSLFPGKVRDFDFNMVYHRTFPKTMFSKRGLELAIELGGFPNALILFNNAVPDRLLEDMDTGNVSKSVVMFIASPDYPCTDFLTGLRQSEKLIPFASLYAYENDKEKKLDQYLSLGVKGFKINPHVVNVNIDHPENIRMLQLAAESRLPILSCSGMALDIGIKGLSKKNIKKLDTQNLRRFGNVLKEIPEAIFIFGHAGCYQNKEVIELMKLYPRTYAEISTQPPAVIKKMISELGAGRLLLGSDYPFFNQAFPILSVLRATENESERKLILGENAKMILNLS